MSQNAKPNRTPQVTSLDVAIRVYPVPPRGEEKPPRHSRTWSLPGEILVIDTETRTDASQALLFGSYRSFIDGEFIEEGIFYPDDISPRNLRTLKRYVRTHRPNTVSSGVRELRLIALQQFLKDFFRSAYRARCLVVGFNLPFDLSRIAYDFRDARGRYAGGFSLRIWRPSEESQFEKNANRPDVDVKHIDSKRALIGFTSRMTPDKVDLIPDDSTTGKAIKGFNHRGHFLDLKTLAYALTDRGHSLASACETFGVEHQKQKK